jgi:TonB family C-terminal domain
MATELIYFLKINIGIALFYAFYRLFFYRDTFFQWRRYALLSFLVISLFYPLMNIQDWVKEQEPINQIATIYAQTILPDIVIKPDNSDKWTEIITNIVPYVYYSGVILLFMRFIVQLFSICILALRSKRAKINGITVRIPVKASAPFSFFRWIFISPELHTEKEAKEILIHEETHVQQMHSIDVILSEIITILCWINPFVWLLKREIRNNLEYMADDNVILSGHDTKSYQYHLLGLANQKAAANLYNSFNVLPLKNRITMMNKKRTKNIGKTKYAIFIPLAALLMLVSNIEAVARITDRLSEEVLQNSSISENGLANSSDYTPIEAEVKLSEPQQGKNTPYTTVEVMPQFPGGTKALSRYISSNLKYPAQALKNEIQGKVYIRFIVTENGDITKATVMRSLNKDCDKEAIRVIRNMPKWKPGKQNGVRVPVYYTIPIQFSLNKNNAITKEKTSVKKGAHEEPYTAVEEMPRFPGGESALLEQISNNLKYPVQSQINRIQGKVYVRITISEDGSVKDPIIMRSLDTYCDQEAIRVMSSLPKWIPGKQNGVNVPVYYVIPITFKLQ